MRILIVTGRFPLRSQSFITNKIIALARRGHDVRVFARSGDIAIDDVLKQAGSRLVIKHLPPEDFLLRRLARLPELLLRGTWKNPAYALQLIQLLRRRYGVGREFIKKLYMLLPFSGEDADVLHFEWSSKAAECAELVDLLAGRKVMSCRGSDVRIMPLTNAKLAQSLRWLFSRVDRVHCVSQAVMRTAEKYGLERQKAFINHPSVDTDYFSPPPRVNGANGAPLRIVSTGRLHWVKGFDYALKAVQLLVERGHPLSYTIIGDGGADSRSQLNFAIRDMGLQEQVTLAGSRSPSEVRTLLAQSDLYLLSSLSEGLSNSTLEAMAMELPVVSTDVGGMSEAIRDGIDGYLVPSREPQKMADRLEALMSDADLRIRMGKSGRQHVIENFALVSQIDKFIECYENLLDDQTQQQAECAPLLATLN